MSDLKLSHQSSTNKITSGQYKQGGTIQTQQSMESRHQVINAPPTHIHHKNPKKTEKIMLKENKIIDNRDTRLSNMVIG